MEEFKIHNSVSKVSNQLREMIVKNQGLVWECRKCHVYILTKKRAKYHVTLKCARKNIIRMPPDLLFCNYCKRCFKTKKLLIKHIYSAPNHYPKSKIIFMF